MYRTLVILMVCWLLSAPILADDSLPIIEVKADRTMIYPQRMDLMGEESLLDVLKLNIVMKNFHNIFVNPNNTIENYPKVFVLNDECFNFFKNNNNQEGISPINGNFYNKILLLNIINQKFQLSLKIPENIQWKL